MRNLRLLIVVSCLVLLMASLSYAQPSVFADIKAEAMKAVPDEDGDYILRVENRGFVYVIGYTNTRVVGCSEANKREAIQRIIFHDEKDDTFYRVSIIFGTVMSEIRIDAEDAAKEAERILNKFHAACDMQAL